MESNIIVTIFYRVNKIRGESVEMIRAKSRFSTTERFLKIVLHK